MLKRPFKVKYIDCGMLNLLEKHSLNISLEYPFHLAKVMRYATVCHRLCHLWQVALVTVRNHWSSDMHYSGYHGCLAGGHNTSQKVQYVVVVIVYNTITNSVYRVSKFPAHAIFVVSFKPLMVVLTCYTCL